jgi:2'-5' RNA ligase
MARLFYALPIDCTPPLRRLLEELGGMGGAMKVVRPQSLHITLRFIGEADDTAAELLGLALDEALGGRSVIDGRFAGVGLFGPPSRPRVVWATVEPAAPIADAAAALARTIEPLGYAPEDRPFTSHVTLARIEAHPPRSLGRWLAEAGGRDLGACRLSGAVLMRSDLSPTGPTYTPVHAVRWSGG